MKSSRLAHGSGVGRAVLIVTLAAAANLAPFWGDAAPREIGAVDWERDFDAALARSKALGRPVFAFFQEVPGCSTCVSFGEQVLEQPMLVEAIETEFVPVLVYNNRPGRDAALLARFGEPAWNNPVVRFLDGDGQDLIPRKAGVWSPYAVGKRMLQALEAAGRPAPDSLRRTVDEAKPRHSELATFGMYCYWSGETCLGSMPGILETRTGAVGGSEVVEVRFDPDLISYPALLREAHTRGCAARVFVRDERQLALASDVFGRAALLVSGALREAGDRDQKYYLKRSRWKNLALTPGQATRVNSAIGRGLDPTPALSPRQQRKASDG
jgi:hypothetical protein